MREIKAYVHAHRVGHVIAALKDSPLWGGEHGAQQHHLAVYVVKGSLVPVDNRERQYSVDLGDVVVNEYKLELLCDDAHVAELADVIRSAARTGQANAGWVYVTEVTQAIAIV